MIFYSNISKLVLSYKVETHQLYALLLHYLNENSLKRLLAGFLYSINYLEL
jgi:hypothetical protein